MNTKSIVTPGQRLGFAQDYAAGSGTYVRGNLLYASVVGVKRVLKPTAEGEAKKKQSAIPEEFSIVTGKVIRITPKEAVVSIMVVGNSPCKEDFQGIIRQRDVRATEKDKVKIHNSFRPGDIIRAEVISLGDARSYYLSTAKNELGVIYAQSVEGAAMIPISWQEMQCTKTNTKELRKCAKPF
ncbi:3380_t:CDS:2 [Funneliformis caledonium]|uniref:3380_t:CDS:1 n=2 Tax=Funneliformis TaxID=1117308 RepID=A0A9N9E6D4_9GLOM|nr:11439_t:CDS:2 [Funneliformis mosseae]CAG8662462.1 3380_t:CDS:2 [Funneliformis caledonium]